MYSGYEYHPNIYSGYPNPYGLSDSYLRDNQHACNDAYYHQSYGQYNHYGGNTNSYYDYTTGGYIPQMAGYYGYPNYYPGSRIKPRRRRWSDPNSKPKRWEKPIRKRQIKEFYSEYANFILSAKMYFDKIDNEKSVPLNDDSGSVSDPLTAKHSAQDVSEIKDADSTDKTNCNSIAEQAEQTQGNEDSIECELERCFNEKSKRLRDVLSTSSDPVITIDKAMKKQDTDNCNLTDMI